MKKNYLYLLVPLIVFAFSLNIQAQALMRNSSNKKILKKECNSLLTKVSSVVLTNTTAVLRLDYTNISTRTVAGAFIEVDLANRFTIDSISRPLGLRPISPLSSSVYRFNTDTLASLDSSYIYIYVKINHGLINPNLIHKFLFGGVEVYCSNSSTIVESAASLGLAVEGVCLGDSVAFRIVNRGVSTTPIRGSFTIIEDNIIFYIDSCFLSGGQSTSWYTHIASSTSSYICVLNTNIIPIVGIQTVPNFIQLYSMGQISGSNNTNIVRNPLLQQITNSRFVFPNICNLSWAGVIACGADDYKDNTVLRIQNRPQNLNTTALIMDYKPSLQSDNSFLSATSNIATKEIIIRPNPFSTATTIELPKAYRQIELAIYDIRGQLVRQIKLANQSKIKLQREGLLAGVYLYHLVADGQLLGNGKIVVQD